MSIPQKTAVGMTQFNAANQSHGKSTDNEGKHEKFGENLLERYRLFRTDFLTAEAGDA